MSSRTRKKPGRNPMMVTGRKVTLRDFAIFQLKLALDGLKDLVVFNVSIVAVVLDFIAGRGQRPRLFYSVVRASERWDRWLNLHGVMERLDEGESEDGFFGASDAGADSLIGQIEELVRGGDEPRGKRKPGGRPSEADDLADLGDLDGWAADWRAGVDERPRG
ncbi:MAG TPA: hypothetical protein VMM35_03540 [Longimicrobiales bacterium]|nr:hypothetical protein [Longimicrobiales bacterium]